MLVSEVKIMKVNVIGQVPREFVDSEIHAILQENPARAIKEITFERLDGDECKESYELTTVPFERIRRITGYLVGTMDRWNDAKRAEEHDRVKHSL